MYRYKNIITVIFVALSFSLASYACEINFETVQGKKAVYSKGDVLTVKVTVESTHRSCSEDINKIKISQTGVKIENASNWAESGSGVWEKKLKIKVDKPQNGKAEIKAVRQCKKDGGSASLTLKVK
jgi:hypothetical protein